MLEFSEICPRWDKKIKTGIDQIDKNGKLLELNDYQNCIIGEAHGFSSGYNQPHHEKYCWMCSQFGNEFFDIEKAAIKRKTKNFAKTKAFRTVQEKFVIHYNMVHVFRRQKLYFLGVKIE